MLKYIFVAALVASMCLQVPASVDSAFETSEDTDENSIRQFFPPSSETMLNEQINREYEASYLYETMAAYFGRPSVGLKGFAKFFKKSANEEQEHARKIIDYVNKRGGKVVLKNIMPPTSTEWPNVMDSLTQSLGKEKELNVKLMSLRNAADGDKDYHLVDFIENEFLTEQVDSIKEFREMIARLARAGPGVGEYLFDKDLQ